MKINRTIVVCVLAVLMLAASGVTIAQRGLDERVSGIDYPNSLRLRPGDVFLVHGAGDVAIELYIDTPPQVSETIEYNDPVSGRGYDLPNQAAVRLQGPVMLARDKESRQPGEVNVKWRYVDTMFSSFSRNVGRPQ